MSHRTAPAGASTTTRGSELEEKIFLMMSQLIEEDRFFARKDCCRIFRKKGYFSKDRDKKIVFDISVEVHLPGQREHSLLILIECKNYGHRVPVDDIEEFYAKIGQITPANTKAIVVSTNSFQEGAFAFARSKGIGLLRHFVDDSIEWVLTRSPSTMATKATSSPHARGALEAMRTQTFTSKYFDFYGYSGDIYTSSINSFVSRLCRFEADGELLTSLDSVAQQFQRGTRVVPYLEQEEIEEVSLSLLKGIGYARGGIDLDAICRHLSTFRDLKVEIGSLASGTLGTISFNPVLIRLDRDQAGNSRRTRFTLAHELGHLVLGHEKYLLRDVCHDFDVDLERPPEIEIKDIARMEWQANYFASCLLLPTAPLVRLIQKETNVRNVVNRGHGLLYLDGQPCNMNTFYSVTAPLVQEFDVSRSAIKIRLIELGILKEEPKQSQSLFHAAYQ